MFPHPERSDSHARLSERAEVSVCTSHNGVVIEVRSISSVEFWRARALQSNQESLLTGRRIFQTVAAFERVLMIFPAPAPSDPRAIRTYSSHRFQQFIQVGFFFFKAQRSSVNVSCDFRHAALQTDRL